MAYLMNIWLTRVFLTLHLIIHAHFLKIRFGIVAENLHYILTHETDGFYEPQVVEMPGKEVKKIGMLICSLLTIFPYNGSR